MAGNTSNVKLGVCKVLYKGRDLGLTKGGVDVEVTTGTHPVNVDQYGETIVNEFITKREVKVTIPLAETTAENLIAIMPGAAYVTDGVKATGLIRVPTNPAANDVVTVNGVVFTFKTTRTSQYDILIGATPAMTAANIVTALSQSIDSAVVQANYSQTVVGTSPAVNAVQVQFNDYGTAGNAFTLAVTATNVTVSGATLTGGVNGTNSRADVTTGIGLNLLKVGGLLVLHPIANADSDTSEDFIIPNAATPGSAKFAYKYNDERIFNTEFHGYPDPATGILFKLGSLTASAS